MLSVYQYLYYTGKTLVFNGIDGEREVAQCLTLLELDSKFILNLV